MTCDRCVYWRMIQGGQPGDGNCHRYPARMMGEIAKMPSPDTALRGVWPITYKDDWCGEYVGVKSHPVQP